MWQFLRLEVKRTYITVDCVVLHTLPGYLFSPLGKSGVCASFRGAVWMGPLRNFSKNDPERRAHDADAPRHGAISRGENSVKRGRE